MHENNRFNSSHPSESRKKNDICEQGILRPILQLLPQTQSNTFNEAYPEEITIALFEMRQGAMRATPIQFRQELNRSVLAWDRDDSNTVDGSY